MPEPAAGSSATSAGRVAASAEVAVSWGLNSPLPPLPGQALEAEAGSHRHIAPAPAVLLLAGHQHGSAATETASQILLPRGDRQAEAGTCLPS